MMGAEVLESPFKIKTIGAVVGSGDPFALAYSRTIATWKVLLVRGAGVGDVDRAGACRFESLLNAAL
jgi:hypothetical protein